jgi:RND family efflux transporter MFP subunit
MKNEKQSEMPEEKEINIEESGEEFEINEENSTPLSSTRKVLIGGIVGVLLISLIGFGAWYFLIKGEGGQAVPAPRGVSFGNDTDDGQKLSAGERKITLTDEQLQAVDLKIVTVGETLDAAAIQEMTTGVVKANEYEETPVISQVSGVVKSISADLGQFVRKGQTIAVVRSEELAQTQSKYLSMKADLDESEKRYKRALSLSEVSEESRNRIDQTTANLKAAEAKLAEVKSDFERSQKLVRIGALSKREFEQRTTALRIAEANLEEAKNRFQRARELLKINPDRKNEIDQFLTKVRNQQAEIASVREKLLVLGLSRNRVDTLRQASQISSDLPVPAPISGTITERIANQNEVISMNGKLAVITDLSTVWVIGQVYEKDLGKLRVGSGASISSDAYPGEIIRGQISYIDPNLDEKTRTAQVRIEIPNSDQKLKIGQYVKVAYARISGAEKTAPLVPKEAVQTIGNQKIVFQATDDPKTFILRPLKLGQEKENSYPVIEGIFVGDKVVTTGSFLLRAEFLKTNGVNF